MLTFHQFFGLFPDVVTAVECKAGGSILLHLPATPSENPII